MVRQTPFDIILRNKPASNGSVEIIQPRTDRTIVTAKVTSQGGIPLIKGKGKKKATGLLKGQVDPFFKGLKQKSKPASFRNIF